MPDSAPHAAIELRAENVHRAFGARRVLNGISMTVTAGEIIAIVGASGSGKTVFLDHLIGLLTPDSGRILVADHDAPPDPSGHPPLVDIASAPTETLDRIRLHWAVVFQRNALFSGTIRDNIALLLRERGEFSDQQVDARARAAIAAARLDVADVLEKDRDELSGGMAKRAAIARAIAMDPIVIFYDEPTTGLDPVVAGNIHELIWRTHHQPVGSLFADSPAPPNPPPRTSVIITHDKDLLRRIGPRVLMLDAGRVCYDGPYHRFGGPDCPQARQYFQAMPVLHAGRPGERD
ncbi:MAG: ATP-binding cassette domain-containing protein [Phycisphaerales bacterium]|nr:ATP-binding cassette domain-containing protein [Phycisphaerales bacterium]